MSHKKQKFEEQIAYFFGAPFPDRVANHYLEALKLLGSREDMLEALGRAYQEVSLQTGMSFEIRPAAEKEYELIIGQKDKRSFEELVEVMVQLYKVVFGVENARTRKAAMLRTFLYQYKTRLEEGGQTLDDNDKEVLLALARASERELNC